MLRVLLGAALLLAAPAAGAAPAQVRVSYADLDLSTRAGVTTLDRRLQGAVRRVCGFADGTAAGSLENAHCIDAARASIATARQMALVRGQRVEQQAMLDVPAAGPNAPRP